MKTYTLSLTKEQIENAIAYISYSDNDSAVELVDILKATIAEHKSFGCLNGFSVTPPEIKRCWEQKHPLKEEVLGRCYSQYTCAICGISYTVDSSD